MGSTLEAERLRTRSETAKARRQLDAGATPPAGVGTLVSYYAREYVENEPIEAGARVRFAHPNRSGRGPSGRPPGRRRSASASSRDSGGDDGPSGEPGPQDDFVRRCSCGRRYVQHPNHGRCCWSCVREGRS
jgi:hypothetical protein